MDLVNSRGLVLFVFCMSFESLSGCVVCWSSLVFSGSLIAGGRGGGSGSQVCLIEEQCGEAGGGGRLSFQTLRQEARQSP